VAQAAQHEPSVSGTPANSRLHILTRSPGHPVAVLGHGPRTGAKRLADEADGNRLLKRPRHDGSTLVKAASSTEPSVTSQEPAAVVPVVTAGAKALAIVRPAGALQTGLSSARQMDDRRDGGHSI
jgi:hypothetical protein